MLEYNLYFDATVIEWIASCHKLCYDHTLHNTLTSNIMTMSVTTMQIFIEINFEGIKITFKRSYDKQNLTLVIISYDIY